MSPLLERCIDAGPAVERVYAHCLGATEGEVGGVLLGHSVTSGRAAVTRIVPAGRTARATRRFALSDADMRDAMARRGGPHETQLIGWYRSRLGDGVFLSRHDVEIHRRYFTDPGQFALVVDPVVGRQALYGWRDDEITEIASGPLVQSRRRGSRPDGWNTSAHGLSVAGAMTALLTGLALGLGLWTVVLR